MPYWEAAGLCNNYVLFCQGTNKNIYYPTLENNFPLVTFLLFVRPSVRHVFDPPMLVRPSVRHVFDLSMLVRPSVRHVFDPPKKKHA